MIRSIIKSFFVCNIAAADTSVHSAVYLRLNHINNDKVNVLLVEDCKLTGFTELTGLFGSCPCTDHASAVLSQSL